MQEPDGERLVRIETILQHLTETVDEVKDYMREERAAVGGMQTRITTQEQKSLLLESDVKKLQEDVDGLKITRAQAIGYVLGAVAAWSVLWTFLQDKVIKFFS